MKPFTDQSAVVQFIQHFTDGAFCYYFEHEGRIFRQTVGRGLSKDLRRGNDRRAA